MLYEARGRCAAEQVGEARLPCGTLEIGVIMRVLDGAEISQDDVLDLEFEAGGQLLAALNDAYIKLLDSRTIANNGLEIAI